MPRIAVPLEITATRLPLAVYSYAASGILGDRLDRGGDAGRIGQAEVALGGDRLRRDDLDFTGAPGLVVKQRLAGGEAGIGLLGQAPSPVLAAVP